MVLNLQHLHVLSNQRWFSLGKALNCDGLYVIIYRLSPTRNREGRKRDWGQREREEGKDGGGRKRIKRQYKRKTKWKNKISALSWSMVRTLSLPKTRTKHIVKKATAFLVVNEWVFLSGKAFRGSYVIPSSGHHVSCLLWGRKELGRMGGHLKTELRMRQDQQAEASSAWPLRRWEAESTDSFWTFSTHLNRFSYPSRNTQKGRNQSP